MFCPKCGQEFEEDAAFCPACGAKKPVETIREKLDGRPDAPASPPPKEDKPPVVPSLKPAEPESASFEQGKETGSKKRKIIVIGAVIGLLAIIILLFAILINSQTLRSYYGVYESDRWTLIVTDGETFLGDKAYKSETYAYIYNSGSDQVFANAVNSNGGGRSIASIQSDFEVVSQDGYSVTIVMVFEDDGAITIKYPNDQQADYFTRTSKDVKAFIKNNPDDFGYYSYYEGYVNKILGNVEPSAKNEQESTSSSSMAPENSSASGNSSTYSIDDVFPALETELMGQTITVTDVFADYLYSDSPTLSTFTLDESGSRYYVNIEFKDEDSYVTATMLLDYVDTLTVCGTVGKYSLTNAWIPDWFAEEAFPDSSDAPSDESDTPDDLSYFEGEYHMAHYYPMQMDLWFPYDVAGTSWRNWESSDTTEINFSFSEGGKSIGSGVAYWYPPESEYPDFEGQFDNSDVDVTITYDGYNFIVNCPELELYDDTFFKGY